MEGADSSQGLALSKRKKAKVTDNFLRLEVSTKIIHKIKEMDRDIRYHIWEPDEQLIAIGSTILKTVK